VDLRGQAAGAGHFRRVTASRRPFRALPGRG
jgi:hypothetical protein